MSVISKMEFIKHLTIFTLISFVNSQTQRQIDNNPNDFRMFENFGLTKNVYINETKIMEKVLDIRGNLQKMKLLITNYKNKTGSLETLKDIKIATNEDFAQIDELYQDFPTVSDWEGAAAGLTKLLITYGINLPKISANRTIGQVCH